MHEKYQNTVNSVHYVCCSACSAKGQHTQFDWSDCNLLERARGLLREGREKWDRILLSRNMFSCVQVLLVTWTQRMNMSSSLPDMSGYREDTVVIMWPQVSHRVHVVIGAFIVGSGQRAGQITILGAHYILYPIWYFTFTLEAIIQVSVDCLIIR